MQMYQSLFVNLFGTVWEISSLFWNEYDITYTYKD